MITISLTISSSIFPRLNSPDRLLTQIKGGGRGQTMREKDGERLRNLLRRRGGGGGFRAKAGLGSEVGNLDVFRGK